MSYPSHLCTSPQRRDFTDSYVPSEPFNVLSCSLVTVRPEILRGLLNCLTQLFIVIVHLYRVILSILDSTKCEYLKDYSLDFEHAHMITYLAS